MKRYITTIIAICFAGSLLGQIAVPLRFDKYHNYSETVDAIKALNKAYPEITKAVLVGKSEENREIWALEINNPKTGNASDKPGVYVDGNIHGNEIQATEVVLYFADYLLKNYGKVPEITKIVDRNSYYLIPVVNVDGRYHFMNVAVARTTTVHFESPRTMIRMGYLMRMDTMISMEMDTSVRCAYAIPMAVLKPIQPSHG